MLNQTFNKNEMIIANINVPGYLTVNIQTISVPRQDLIRVQEFINIFPCDMNVKIKLMKDDTKLMHYINSNFQNKVVYTETHAIYEINQYISLPIKISQLDVSYKLKIKICQQNKPAVSFYFNLFREQFQLDYFQNGEQTYEADNGIKLNFEILPQAQQDIVYHIETHCQTHYKTRYKNNPREIQLQLSDFEEIINTGKVTDKQLAEMTDLYRQNMASDILNYHPIFEPVNTMKQSQLYEGATQDLQVYDIHIKSTFEHKSPLELFSQNAEGSVILDQLIEEMDKDGEIMFDETKQVNILPRCDFITIQNDLKNIMDNNFNQTTQTYHIPKNTLDYFFQYETVTEKLYQSDQRYQNNASLINDLALDNNTHNIPSQYQVMKIKEILKMSYLQDLSVQEAKILLQYKYYIKDKFVNSIYRLSEAFCICQIIDEESLQDLFDNKFHNVQMHEILMLFELSESKNIQFFRKLGVQYLNLQPVSNIKKYMLQLTIQLQLDSQDDELENLMTKLTTQKHNLYKLVQYYHYLNTWKMLADDKNDTASSIKYKKCMTKYLQTIDQFSKFKNHLLKSVELQNEMFMLVKVVKTLSNDRQEQLLLLRQELKKCDKYSVLLGKEPVMFPFIIQNGYPIWVQGLYNDECHVFKSAKKPFLIHLKQINSETLVNQLIDLSEIKDKYESNQQSENNSSGENTLTKNGDDSQLTNASQDNITSTAISYDTLNDHNIGKLSLQEQEFLDLQLLLKYNDDVCQDTVILQQFEIIDHLLKHQHQDLCYTQFTAFPFSHRFGMVQIVHPCICIDDIIKDKRFITIQSFLKHCRNVYQQSPEFNLNSIILMEQKTICDTLGSNMVVKRSSSDLQQLSQQQFPLQSQQSQYQASGSAALSASGSEWACELSQAEQTERFCRSLALYTSMTYAFGVGDRHLENILVRPDGRVIHVDFGWAFGREPRGRGSSRLKVSPEMIEAMDGAEGAPFKRFIALACGAWALLRDASNMTVAALLTAKKALPTLQQPNNLAWLAARIRPELDSEHAALHFLQVLLQQISSGAGNFMDQLHRWAQVTKK